MSELGAEEICEAMSGDYCEPVEIAFPSWLKVTKDVAVLGHVLGVIYLDDQDEMFTHTFENGAPVLMGSGNGLIILGPFEVTDRGIEDQNGS